MRSLSITVLYLMLVPSMANAVTCANGVYHAGCVGPNGAATVRKMPVPPVPPRGTVNCTSGPNRAGCVGPQGNAVVR